MTFIILARQSDDPRLFVMNIGGAKDAETAMQMVKDRGIFPVSVESDHSTAAQKAAQINAANGVIAPGCGTC